MGRRERECVCVCVYHLTSGPGHSVQPLDNTIEKTGQTSSSYLFANETPMKISILQNTRFCIPFHINMCDF